MLAENESRRPELRVIINRAGEIYHGLIILNPKRLHLFWQTDTSKIPHTGDKKSLDRCR